MADALGPYLDDAGLRSYCERARAAGRLALDVEFIRERTYFPRIALVQLAVGDDAALVDPLGECDPAPLDDVISDRAVVKVLHAAVQDLEIFFVRTRRPPANIFDTQIAAALVGLGGQLAYGALVQKMLGVSIPKGESYTDWLQRPLSREQERYALSDVAHLLPLHDRLSERLRELGREAWVAEECAHFEEPGLYEQDPSTVWRRVRRSGALGPRGLAILRELAGWREAEAREDDRPRRRVLEDDTLVELARMAPATLDDLRRFRGLHPRALARSGEAIVAAIQRGLAIPDADCPRTEPFEKLDQDAALAAEFLDACLRALASRASIAPGTIGTRAEIEELVARHRAGTLHEGDVPIFRGWRRTLIGDDLLAFLRGETAVSLDPASGAPRFTARGKSLDTGR